MSCVHILGMIIKLLTGSSAIQNTLIAVNKSDDLIPTRHWQTN